MNELETPSPRRAPGAQGLAFRLFGFPTRIDPSFLLIVALLGFDGSMSHLAIWVGLALVSILGHELGHAVAARGLGAEASITLQGLGGLTRSYRTKPFSRAESALLTAAGPGAGILLGLPVLFAIGILDWPSWTLGGFALRTAVFTTLGWSAFNLLPVVPLDGGHLLETALPGTPAERRRLAAKVSIAVAAAGAVLAYRAGLPFAGLLAVLFAAQNLATLRQPVPSDEEEPSPGSDERPAAPQA